KELENSLVGEKGIYKLKGSNLPISFVLTAEISSIYSQGGKVRRIHNVLVSSSLEKAGKFNKELSKRGVNLSSDGRPITNLSAEELLKIFRETDEEGLFIPAHIWTPWFSLFGANSGFDSLKECFKEMSKYIVAVETGLSSDPLMNWKVEDLKGKGIVSFSDAHSPQNLGRELTVIEIKELNFSLLAQALSGGAGISYTVEFYPEEGKYHYTGHRNCGVAQKPEETKRKGTTCPVCGKPLTIGVMHRVLQLSGEIEKPQYFEDDFGLRWIKDQGRPPYISLVPLLEIISEAKGYGKLSKKVLFEYQNLIEKLGSELTILMKIRTEEIARLAGEKIAEGIKKVRKGDIHIKPGFDGEYGKVKVWPQEEKKIVQKGLF
ncbi:endonuclease Q family protein, partial [Patescibacteria group bacterium]|nr:endonuclease Q family protein [Patescibacteria group bacterium]